MPKIPLSDNNFVQNSGRPVYMNNAPALNAGTQHGAALQRLGGSIIGAGQDIAAGASRMAAAKAEFEQKSKDTSNRIAAMKARNLWKSTQHDLEKRMAQNPAEFASFSEWAKEADSVYAENVSPFLDEMDEDFRKGFEVEMAGLREEAAYERDIFSINAKITAQQNDFRYSWQNAVLSGDLAEADRLLAEFSDSGLISSAEKKQRTAERDSLAEFGAVKRLVDAGDTSVLADLKARDDSGYTHYRNITEAQREQFIRAAEAAAAQQRLDKVQSFVAELWSGKIYSNEDVDAMFPEPSAQDTATANSMKSVLQTFNDRRDAAARRSAAEKEAAAAQESAEERAKAKEEEDRFNAEFDRFRWKMFSHQFSTDPNERQKEYADLSRQILEHYVGDVTRVKALQELLDDNYSASSPEASGENNYKHTPAYTYMMQKLNELQGEIKYYEEGWFWDSPGGGDDEKVLEFIDERAVIEGALFIKNNPAATQQEIDDFLAHITAEVAKKKVSELFDFWVGVHHSNQEYKVVPAGE